jgi:hypothetical protein
MKNVCAVTVTWLGKYEGPPNCAHYTSRERSVPGKSMIWTRFSWPSAGDNVPWDQRYPPRAHDECAPLRVTYELLAPYCMLLSIALSSKFLACASTRCVYRHWELPHRKGQKKKLRKFRENDKWRIYISWVCKAECFWGGARSWLTLSTILFLFIINMSPYQRSIESEMILIYSVTLLIEHILIRQSGSSQFQPSQIVRKSRFTARFQSL